MSGAIILGGQLDGQASLAQDSSLSQVGFRSMFSDVVITPLAANSTFQSGPFDMTNVLSGAGVAPGYVAFVATLVTDTAANAEIWVQSSVDGITFATQGTVSLVQQTDGNYLGQIDVPWRGPRWYRVAGTVGSIAATTLFTCTAGQRS